MAEGAFPSRASDKKDEPTKIKIGDSNWSDLKMLVPNG